MRNSEPSFFYKTISRITLDGVIISIKHSERISVVPLQYQRASFSLDVNVENITNQIYFDTLALPSQFDGNIQIVSTQLKQDFRLGKFTLGKQCGISTQLQSGCNSAANADPVSQFCIFTTNGSKYQRSVWRQCATIQHITLWLICPPPDSFIARNENRKLSCR